MMNSKTLLLLFYLGVVFVSVTTILHSSRVRLLSSSINYEVLINEEKPNPQQQRPIKILYTVFAGRKSRLLLQEPYWVEMIQANAIDEIHLWDFVQLQNREDKEHLQHLARKYSFITVLHPLDNGVVAHDGILNETYWYDKNHSLSEGNDQWLRIQPSCRSYTEYYAYYTQNPYPGVIIKADDDIVYINSTMVRPFAEYLSQHKEIFLLSASVVNQGLCAYFQQRHGAIPKEIEHFPYPDNGMGRLQTDATQAQKLHQWFLESEENRQRFFIQQPTYYQYNYTININFIAIRGEDWHETYELIQERLKDGEIPPYYDEGAITWGGIRTRKHQQGIYMPLVVAHCSFSHQRQLDKEIEKIWFDWARRERADFYKGILD